MAGTYINYVAIGVHLSDSLHVRSTVKFALLLNTSSIMWLIII